MMWIIRKILARIGIRREADMHCPDGRMEVIKIINESRNQIQIKVFMKLGMFYGRWVCPWVDKTEATITNLRWPHGYRQNLVMVTRLLIIGLFVASSVNILYITMHIEHKQQIINTIDQVTGLPVVDTIYDGSLPDGHYFVAKIFPSGAMVMVQHKADKWRDFTYHILSQVHAQLPFNLQEGDRFTIFDGQVI